MNVGSVEAMPFLKWLEHCHHPACLIMTFNDLDIQCLLEISEHSIKLYYQHLACT